MCVPYVRRKALRKTVVLGLAFVCLVSAAAFANTLYLTPPTGGYLGYGAGGTRGDYITMTGDLAITSIGIQGAIDAGTQMTFNAYVYDLSGNPLMVGGSKVFTGDGTEQWFDLDINYNLLSGKSYDIGIDFHGFNAPNWQVHYYFFDAGSNSPFSVGPVTVFDGEESHCGACNVYAPNLRLNGSGGGVPEPGTFVMLGTGALGLAGALKRKLVG